MRKILIAAFAVSILFASCKKKENVIPVTSEKSTPQDSTYIINGVTDFSISSLDSQMVGMNIIFQQGAQEKIKLSVEGLPDRVKADFTPASGFPGFSTIFMLTSVVAKPGVYPITIKGTSSNGLVKTYNVDLTIKDDFRCDSFLLTNLGMFKTLGTFDDSIHGTTSIGDSIVNDMLQLNSLYLDTVIGAKVVTGINTIDRVKFTIDCEKEMITIPLQTIKAYTLIGLMEYKVSGKGMIHYDKRTVHIDYTVVNEENKSQLFRLHGLLDLWK